MPIFSLVGGMAERDNARSLDSVLGPRELNSNGLPVMQPCSSGPFSFVPGSLDRECDMFHFWSLHQGGAHFSFADGSVHFISYIAWILCFQHYQRVLLAKSYPFQIRRFFKWVLPEKRRLVLLRTGPWSVGSGQTPGIG